MGRSVEGPRSTDTEMSGTKHVGEATGFELWSKEERQQQVLHYKAPEFTTRYPLGINSYGTKASKDTHEWLLETGLDKVFRSPKAFAKFVAADIPALVSKVYVDHGPEALKWASKFFTWLFVLDDQMDETAVGSKRRSLVPVFLDIILVFLWNFPDDPVLNDCLLEFLDQLPNPELREKNREFISNAVKKEKSFPVVTVYDGKLGPVASSLRELWATSVKMMPEVYNLRFARTMQDYFLGNLEEAKHREDKVVPSIEEYNFNRRRTGAVAPTIVMVDLFEEVCMSSELFNSTPMKQLMEAISDIVDWHNDIWSFKKEMSRGSPTVHNLVVMISHERMHCSYKQCSLIARDMIYDRITDLEKAAVDLLAIAPPAYENVVQRYIKTCRYWVPGTQDWHMACGRYTWCSSTSTKVVQRSTQEGVHCVSRGGFLQQDVYILDVLWAPLPCVERITLIRVRLSEEVSNYFAAGPV